MSVISKDRLLEIKSKAKKATKGKWVCYAGTPFEDCHPKSIFVEHEDDHSNHAYEIAEAKFCGTGDDAKYIASLSPDVIVPIIDELLELRDLTDPQALTITYFAGQARANKDLRAKNDEYHLWLMELCQELGLPSYGKEQATGTEILAAVSFLKQKFKEMCGGMPCEDCPLGNDVDGCEMKNIGSLEEWIASNVYENNGKRPSPAELCAEIIEDLDVDPELLKEENTKN